MPVTRTSTEASRKAYRADWHLRNKYGITTEARDALFAKQDFKCAVCAADTAGGNGHWKVDHCHTTGKVRGILCPNCNVGIGHFRDSRLLLGNAIKYLQDNE